MSAAPCHVRSGAVLDPTGAYRYRLWREWDSGLPVVTFIMLNPSTADAQRDDPTIRRCIRFAAAWGFGRLEVVNLFAFRATSPAQLPPAAAACGPENEAYIEGALAASSLAIAAWGNAGHHLEPRFAGPLACLGLTRYGAPRHPLYVRGDAIPVAFR